MYGLRKSATLTCLYEPMYLQLDDYPPYFEKNPVRFETQINRNLRCSHGYTNCVRHTDFINWVSKNSWEMLLSEFSHAEIISGCPTTIIFNKCEKNNTRGDILNSGDNIDDQENFGFTESYFKIAPSNIDDYTKTNLLNMQQENLRPQSIIETNGKQTDEILQNNLIDDKEYDEKDQISKDNEET